MRIPICALFLSLAMSTSSLATEIEQAHMRCYEVKDFQRLSEFFTGKEHTENKLILRTDPSKRAGVYVDLKLDCKVAELPTDSKAVLHAVFENNREVQTFTLPIKGDPTHTKKLMVGVTGDNWKDEAKIIAWYIEIQDETGNTLCDYKSFLWEMPL